MIQHPPQLRLKQHHKGQQSHCQELAQNEVNGVKLRHIRQPGDDDNGHSHLGNPGRAGGLEQGKQFIDDQRHQCNVQKVGPLHDRQLRHQIVNGFHVCNSLFYVNFSAERTPLSYTLPIIQPIIADYPGDSNRYSVKIFILSGRFLWISLAGAPLSGQSRHPCQS